MKAASRSAEKAAVEAAPNRQQFGQDGHRDFLRCFRAERQAGLRTRKRLDAGGAHPAARLANPDGWSSAAETQRTGHKGRAFSCSMPDRFSFVSFVFFVLMQPSSKPVMAKRPPSGVASVGKYLP
jgi:hypothetical protein